MTTLTSLDAELDTLGENFRLIERARTRASLEAQEKEKRAREVKAEEAEAARLREAEHLSEASARYATSALLVAEASDIIKLPKATMGVYLARNKPYGLTSGELVRYETPRNFFRIDKWVSRGVFSFFWLSLANMAFWVLFFITSSAPSHWSIMSQGLFWSLTSQAFLTYAPIFTSVLTLLKASKMLDAYHARVRHTEVHPLTPSDPDFMSAYALLEAHEQKLSNLLAAEQSTPL